ncbi:polysaccharide pyruvyl transferase family protein [Nitratireductor sp. ZSWI3]|uniref:polysaccharide pyruvyl transferase family protein n=1 Tax=Nitratireductor sp. ZSWI3 TaxID=2966359 RepID=UPI0021504A1C|nr:polysaccharide pyruvyl transferase family protein [Nitratireductor sp. ZSWI3]MCR4265861.1 polysaccharide pyruvyl transferase family protein [Nitratireductor sp. ZSWI3]
MELDREWEKEHLDRIYESILSVCALGADNAGSAAPAAYLEKLCVERCGRYAQQVKDADLVIFQAEGTMAGTDFLRGARLLLLPFVAKHMWRKPVYSLNQTIFAGDDRFSEVLAAAYNSLDFVAVRENISVSAARQIGIRSVFHIPDTAFLTRPAPDPRLPDLSRSRHFMVSGSAYFSPEIHEQIFSAATRIKSETGLVPVIAASTEADEKLERLAAQYWEPSSYEVIPPTVSYSAVASAMDKCRFLLSGRYHMNIMAASANLPVIQVRGNSYKNEGLAAMLGDRFPVRDPADTDGIAGQAAGILDGASQMRKDLSSSLATILRSIGDASAWLEAAFAGRAGPYPASFLVPPGNEIDAAAHMEPYLSNSIENVRAFAYQPNSKDPLGPRPTGSSMLPPLYASYRGGDERALPAIRQIVRSYPDALAEVADEGMRLELSELCADTPVRLAAEPRAGATYGVEIIDRLLHSTFADMKSRTVEGADKTYSYGRSKDLSVHILSIRNEFVGAPELCLYHAILVVLIRRNINLEENVLRFRDLWDREGAFLCERLDSRWLVSACDTIIDHGRDTGERALAMSATLFTNTVKLYETERWATAAAADAAPYREISERVPLHDGLSAFAIGRGDMIKNLEHRLLSFADEDSAAFLILRELFSRAGRFDTVFRRFASVSEAGDEASSLSRLLGYVSRPLRKRGVR